MASSSEPPAPTAVMSSPAPFAHLALIAITLVSLVLPVPPNINVVITASLAVWAGCWRSVKPEVSSESMTKGEAMRFPLVGSCVLFGLFLAFKFLPKELVNMLLTCYIAVLSVVVLTTAVMPYVEHLFPKKLQTTMITLPKVKIPHFIDTQTEPIEISLPTIIMSVVCSGFCLWYIMKKHWVANNILGLALSLEGIEHLSLGSVHVGCILLVGLFFYDIFWVFCTPVMVSVAKNFDAPIKLLFPRGLDAVTGKQAFSMLGLGDIVIPGIFVALMLRLDVHKNLSKNYNYFYTAFFGYVLGLGTTIVVMNVFNAAQPALLYIVPSVLGCIAVKAWWAGELVEVFNHSETPPEEAHPAQPADAVEAKKDK